MRQQSQQQFDQCDQLEEELGRAQSKPTHAKAFGAAKVAKLTKDDAKPKVVWRRAGGPLKDYAAFLDALRTGKLDDRLDYAY